MIAQCVDGAPLRTMRQATPRAYSVFRTLSQADHLSLHLRLNQEPAVKHCVADRQKLPADPCAGADNGTNLRMTALESALRPINSATSWLALLMMRWDIGY